MKKKKGFLIFTVVFLAAIVFAIFYFRDPANTEAIEKEQDADAVETADELIDNLNSSFNDINFEEDTSETSTIEIEQDSLADQEMIETLEDLNSVF